MCGLKCLEGFHRRCIDSLGRQLFQKETTRKLNACELSPNSHHARPPNWSNVQTRSSFLNHFLFLISYLVFVSFHTFLTYFLHHLVPMVPTVSFLYEILSMPMTRSCHVFRFTILYLFYTKSTSRFSFFLKNSNYL